MRVPKIGKRLFLPKKREFFMPITEGRTRVQKTLERKKGFFFLKKREFFMPITARVTKLPVIKLPSYRVTSHRVTKLPSNQSSITSHQEGNYQTDGPKHLKRREEDTCLITVDYRFDTN